MLDKYEVVLEQWLKEIITTGNDDSLFASGYLQGHFAVVLSELELEQKTDFSELENKMCIGLQTAKQELSAEDFQLVQQAWQQLRDAIILSL